MKKKNMVVVGVCVCVGGVFCLLLLLLLLLFCFSFFSAMMNKQNIDYRDKLSPCEYIVLYHGKFQLKPRLFLPAILAGN